MDLGLISRMQIVLDSGRIVWGSELFHVATGTYVPSYSGHRELLVQEAIRAFTSMPVGVGSKGRTV